MELGGMPRDEARASRDADHAHSRRWAVWHHQFDLVRAVDGVRYLRRHRDSRIVDWVLTGAFTHETIGYLTTDMDHLYLIEGGARGADRLAAAWARDCPLHGPYFTEAPPDEDEPGVIHVPYPARWNEHDFEGTSGVKCVKAQHLCMPGVFPCRRAGARRNQRMLDDQKPDYVIAFKDGFNARVGRGGTEDMVNRAKGAGVTTYVIQHG